MRLTESQLFVIEALNKIKWFVWPKRAEFAAMDSGDEVVYFYEKEPKENGLAFVHWSILDIEYDAITCNPDWRNSLITKEQFESVDGWVLGVSTDYKNKVEVMYDPSNGKQNWRYVSGGSQTHQPPQRKVTTQSFRFSVEDAPVRNGDWWELYGGGWSTEITSVPVVPCHSLWNNCKYIEQMASLGLTINKVQLMQVDNTWMWELTVSSETGE